MALLLLSSIKDQESARGQALTSEPVESDVQYSQQLDPEPLFKLRAEDRSSDVIEEPEFKDNMASSFHLCKTARFLTANGIKKDVGF